MSISVWRRLLNSFVLQIVFLWYRVVARSKVLERPQLELFLPHHFSLFMQFGEYFPVALRKVLLITVSKAGSSPVLARFEQIVAGPDPKQLELHFFTRRDPQVFVIWV